MIRDLFSVLRRMFSLGEWYTIPCLDCQRVFYLRPQDLEQLDVANQIFLVRCKNHIATPDGKKQCEQYYAFAIPQHNELGSRKHTLDVLLRAGRRPETAENEDWKQRLVERVRHELKNNQAGEEHHVRRQQRRGGRK